MSYLEKYQTWDDVVSKAYRPEMFTVKSGDVREDEQVLISERLLFTQSNTKVLLGHDPRGRMHFACIPTSVDYPIPTGKVDRDQAITAGFGMYYQTDMVMFLGKLSFSYHPENSEEIELINKDTINYYADHFLPLTLTKSKDMQAAITSFAPLSANGKEGLDGAFYTLNIKNTGNTPLKGKVHLNFDNLMISQYEHGDKVVESRGKQADLISNDGEILMLWRPDGCVGIHLHGGKWIQDARGYVAETEIYVDTGEEHTVDVRVALGMNMFDIRPAISKLYMYTSLEWFNILSEFWCSKLGSLCVDAWDGSKEAMISRDNYIRNIIDNFNCLQTDAHGDFKVHWQGAPSHNCGRLWGIDVEPTVISIMHIMPELGLKALKYFMWKNQPARRVYREHSTPILIAPLLLARKYIEYTGDINAIQNDYDLMKSLAYIIDELMEIKHCEIDLFPSRYSSDGLVMRRYDHGTNVKV